MPGDQEAERVPAILSAANLLNVVAVKLPHFSHIYIDILGPQPSSHGFSYLLAMIDRMTRVPEVAPLASISAESYIRAFISTSRFSASAVFTSKRGTQFTSYVWTGVCSSLGISASTRTAIHPVSNGIIECLRCSLKSTLRSPLAGSGWFLYLPLVLLGLRTVPKEDTGLSVSKVV